ncbi:MAG: PTS sugar transporter subunit IIC [Clostridia bacterium]|nr:PTS sugar transporter subunit IIC [Clostridia bacterium]
MNKKNSIKTVLNKIFIDGFSGMASGLFCTLIIGTIIGQIGSYIPGVIGTYIILIGAMAKCLMGAGIGVGVAVKFNEKPLVTLAAAVCGMIGAFSSKLFTMADALPAVASKIEGAESLQLGNFVSGLIGVGEPLGAFIAALIGIWIGHLVVGKTKIDIIVTPLCSIVAGATVGIIVGPYVSTFMTWLGGLVNWGTEQAPLLMGIIVSVLMGLFLTLPISSAAIGITLGLSGIAAGASTVGCCCQMVGFAVISYRENKVDGLLSQGLGTSMLQMPNIIKNPKIWIPPTVASAVLGPISTCVLKMTCNSVGSGMGTSGLVGPLQTFAVMKDSMNTGLLLLEILFMYFVLPAVISLGISEFMRKKNWIKSGDLKIDV